MLEIPRLIFDYSLLSTKFANSNLIIGSMRGIEYVKAKYPELIGPMTNFLPKEQGYPNQNTFNIDLDKVNVKKLPNSIYNIVVIGGGASLDFGKVIASRICTETNQNYLIKVLLIPTNIGSAAEITNFSTIWDYKSEKKLSVELNQRIDRTVLYDTNSLKGLSQESKIIGLLDAVSHTFDSLNSKNSITLLKQIAANNLEAGISALEGLRLHPSNVPNELLQSISSLGGICISTTKTSITHGLSYGLTLSYNIQHGVAVGLVLKAILNLNSSNRLLGQKIPLALQLKKELNLIDFQNLINSPVTSLNYEKLINQIDRSRVDNFIYEINRRDIITIFQSIESELIL